MKTAAEVRNQATLAERNRLQTVINTQISILWDRVEATKTDDLKSAWTIAILELEEVKKMVNYPLAEQVFKQYHCDRHMIAGSNHAGKCSKCEASK